MAKLTQKQEKFCHEYLVDLNLTQSAIRAGYSEKTAYSIGAENLKKPEIRQRISELQIEQSERTQLKSDDVINELKKIAFADVETTGREKLKALELLGKHLGIFEKQTDAGNQNVSNLLEMIEKGLNNDL